MRLGGQGELISPPQLVADTPEDILWVEVVPTGTGALIVYVGLPELIWYGGREGLATLAMLGPCLALGWLRAARGRLREHRLALFALVLCSLVLSARVGGWALFILD